MSDVRILFRKTGRAVYISHLDLMRTMQRVFIRSGLKLRHSEGFNPHPIMVFALPLSVGVESGCELLDVSLLEDIPLSEIPGRLNPCMPEGIEAVSAYVPGRKLRELFWLEVETTLEYDSGVPAGAVDRLNSLYSRETLIINKKSKKGYSDTDIAPCIGYVEVKEEGKTVLLHSLVTAQAPALNPENLVHAIRQLMPELTPDFARHTRLEVYDRERKLFR